MQRFVTYPMLADNFRRELNILRARRFRTTALGLLHRGEIGTDCGICYNEIEAGEDAIRHCTNIQGELAENALSYHVNCLEMYRAQQRRQTLVRNRFQNITEMPCPSCSSNLLSNAQLNQTRQQLMNEPLEIPQDMIARRDMTFGQYYVEPLSKLGQHILSTGQNLLNRVGGYRQLQQEEMEMVNLHVD